ncbi:uncharacterized protein JCM10292_006845 [Rhodotorula paludigena]|uniref:uncharacterized protein n=1 Tax=Rhodotorula paludigena TaxID=86838 RepID=UPI0031788614
MPFRAPLPSQHPSVLSPPSPPPSSAPPSIHSSPARPTPAPTRLANTAPPPTLRLPAPPPPPKPLYLSTRRGRGLGFGQGGRAGAGSTDVEDKENGKRSRGRMPRWSDAELGEVEDEGVEGSASARETDDARAAAGAAVNEHKDVNEQGGSVEQTRTALERLSAPSASSARETDPPSPARRPSTFSTASGAAEVFRTPVGTLKVGASGGGDKRASTIRVRDKLGRNSIFFDASRENPFLPPSLSLDSLEPAAEPADPPLLPLPARVTPALALHAFAGEPTFGELTFAQGVALQVEIEDLGGGWSLGWIEEAGEEERGLIPRGWYAYVDAPVAALSGRAALSDGAALDEDAPPASAAADEQTSSLLADTDLSSGDANAVPLRSSAPTTPTAARPSALDRLFSPSSANSTPFTTRQPFARSTAPSPDLSSSPSPDRSLVQPNNEPSAELDSTAAAGAAERSEDEEAASYATRSIGRHVVVSGTEFEPTWLDGLGETGEGQVAKGAIVSRDEQWADSPGSQHGQDTPHLLAPDGDGAEEKQDSSDDLPQVDLLSLDEQNIHRPPTPQSPAPVQALTYPRPLDVGPAVRPPSPATPPRQALSPAPTSSLLFRLGLTPSSNSSVSGTFSFLVPALGRTSIPGASILAATSAPPSSPPRKARLPRLGSTRRGAAPTAADSKALLLRWIEEGDELDEEVGDESQTWEIDEGPVWRRTGGAGMEENVGSAYEVYVGEGRKTSPLGEAPYIAYEISTVFPPASPAPSRASTSSTSTSSLRTLIVNRRYSHFQALHKLLVSRFHAPLISIPPLPPSAPLAFGAARFDAELVETRRRELEVWLKRCARHEVLASSEEMRGFLALEGEKDLAHHLLLDGPSPAPKPLPLFPSRVFHPPFNVDLEEAAQMVESFERHCRAVQVGAGWKAVEDAVRTGREAKRDMAAQLSFVAHSLARLVSGATLPSPSSDPPQLVQALEDLSEQESQRTRAAWWRVQNEARAFSWKDEDAAALGVSKAVQLAAEAISKSAEIEYDTARSGLLEVEALLHENANPLSQHAPLIDLHHALISTYSRLSRLSGIEASSTADQLARCETLLNIACAEMHRVMQHRCEDLRDTTRRWIEEEVHEKEQTLACLIDALQHFDPSSLSSLALTGPRLRSPLEALPQPVAFPPLPSAGVYGRMTNGALGTTEGLRRATTLSADKRRVVERASGASAGAAPTGAGGWRESVFGSWGW